MSPRCPRCPRGMAGGVDKVWVISSALCSPLPISSTRCQPSLHWGCLFLSFKKRSVAWSSRQMNFSLWCLWNPGVQATNREKFQDYYLHSFLDLAKDGQKFRVEKCWFNAALYSDFTSLNLSFRGLGLHIFMSLDLVNTVIFLLIYESFQEPWQ